MQHLCVLYKISLRALITPLNFKIYAHTSLMKSFTESSCIVCWNLALRRLYAWLCWNFNWFIMLVGYFTMSVGGSVLMAIIKNSWRRSKWAFTTSLTPSLPLPPMTWIYGRVLNVSHVNTTTDPTAADTLITWMFSNNFLNTLLSIFIIF